MIKSFEHLVIEAALSKAPELPPAQRADLFEGIANLIRPNGNFTEADWEAATKAARALREAESAQLLFTNLIVKP